MLQMQLETKCVPNNTCNVSGRSLNMNDPFG